MIPVALLDRRDCGSCGHVGDFLDPTRMTLNGVRQFSRHIGPPLLSVPRSPVVHTR